MTLKPNEFEDIMRTTPTNGYSPGSIKTDRSHLNPSTFSNGKIAKRP